MVLFGGASGYPDSLELNLVSSGSHSLILPKLFDYIATPEELSWRANDVFDWITQGRLKWIILPCLRFQKQRKLFKCSKARRQVENSCLNLETVFETMCSECY